MKAKVEGHVNIYKDTESGVIENKDNTERSRYRIARDHAKESLQSKFEIERLSNELTEIKSLLKQLVKNNGT